MKNVRFLKSHPDYGYFAGDETELNIKNADALLESGHVEEVKEKATKKEASEPEKPVAKTAEPHAKATHPKTHKK